MSSQFDIVVIGAGPGGYIAALKGAAMGASVAIVEKHHLGGTCLNYGCIPSKALLSSAELLHKIHRGGDLGVTVDGAVSFDWPRIQKRKDKVLAKLRSGIKGLFGARQVTLYAGTAKFRGYGKIQVIRADGATEQIIGKKVIIASGSVPTRIPGWPADPNLVCTSDEALHWDKLPKRLLIVGGGVIGCEFACMMHEYGVDVTVVEMLDGLLPGMERQLGTALEQAFTKRGIKVLTSVKVEALKTQGNSVTASISGQPELVVDKVLVAIGRRPNTQDLGLETIGLDTDRGFIRVNDRMQTSVAGVYCIGDANGRCLLAHAASAHGVTAVEDALGHGKDLTLPVPGAVYTFPEVGAVGLTTQQANDQGIPVRVGEFPIGHLGKAMAVGEEFGFVRVVSHRDTDALLGVHMIGHNATEIIEAATAMLGQQASTQALGEMIFAHPTIGEAMKEAAEDVFSQALHLPPRQVVKVAGDVKEV
jgi:dihydrolipoamide dehydrogenase